MRLFNLGTGAAKDISVEWRFAIEQLVEKTNQISQRSFAEIYFEHEKAKHQLSVKTKNGRQATYFLKNDLHRQYDYVLPCSVENTGLKVELPGSYVNLISMYLYLAFSHKNDDGTEPDDDLLQLELFVKFNDIAGNRYSKQFKLRMQLMVYSHSDPPSFDAYFDPQR